MRDKSFSLRRLSSIIIANEWLIVFLLFPIVFFPGFLSGIVNPVSNPLRIVFLLIIPLLWLLRKIECGHFVISTPLDFPILVTLVMVLISLFVTFDILYSLSKISSIVYGVGIFYATVAATSRCRKSLARGVGVLVAFGFLVAILTLLGSNWPTKYSLFATITSKLPRVTFFPDTPGLPTNQLAGILLWVFPVSIAAAIIGIKEPGFWFARLEHRRGTVPFVVGSSISLLIGFTLLLTQTRSAYLGATFALVILVLGIWGRRLRKGLLIIPMIVVLVTVGMWLATFSESGSDSTQIVDEIVTLGRVYLPVDSLQSRLEIWSRALYGIEDFPLTGIGIGAFTRILPVLYPMFLVSPDQVIHHAHNLFLQVALNLGIPGLIAYLAILLGIASMLWQTWSYGSIRPIRLLTLGFVAALIGYIIYSLTNVVVFELWQGFWLLLGLITGLFLLEQKSTYPAFSKIPGFRRD